MLTWVFAAAAWMAPPIAAPGGPVLEVQQRVATGIQPKSVTVSPDGTTLVVCNFGEDRRDNVFLYDVETLTRTATVKFEGTAVESAFAPDSKTVYVTNFARGVVEVIDIADARVVREIGVGSNPKTIVVSPDGAAGYVANWSSKTVTVLDLAAGVRDYEISTGRRPRGLAVGSDGTLFVAPMWDHQLHVYAPGATRPSVEKRVCSYPRHLVMAPDESAVFVSCSGNRRMRWLSPDPLKVRGQSRAGHNPRTLDLSADGRYAATADFHSDTVSVVDLQTMTRRVNEVPGADGLVGLAFDPKAPLRLFVTSWRTNELLALVGDVPAESTARDTRSDGDVG